MEPHVVGERDAEELLSECEVRTSLVGGRELTLPGSSLVDALERRRAVAPNRDGVRKERAEVEREPLDLVGQKELLRACLRAKEHGRPGCARRGRNRDVVRAVGATAEDVRLLVR